MSLIILSKEDYDDLVFRLEQLESLQEDAGDNFDMDTLPSEEGEEIQEDSKEESEKLKENLGKPEEIEL